MTVPQPVLAFVILTLLKSIGQSFVECLSFWVCLMFSHGEIEVLHFSQEYRCDVVMLRSSQSIVFRAHDVICLINGDVELDHLGKEVSA